MLILEENVMRHFASKLFIWFRSGLWSVFLLNSTKHQTSKAVQFCKTKNTERKNLN